MTKRIAIIDIVNLYHELNGLVRDGQTKINGLLSLKAPLSIKLQLSRLARALAPEINLYHDEQRALWEKYGTADGQGGYKLEGEAVAKFNEELADLLKTTVEVLWPGNINWALLEQVETEEYYPVLFSLLD